jgi:hypothetical protein
MARNKISSIITLFQQLESPQKVSGSRYGWLRLADERSWQGTVWTWNVNVALQSRHGATALLMVWKTPSRV